MKKYKAFAPKIREQRKATYGNILDEDTREMLQEIMEHNEIQYARQALMYCIEAVWEEQIGKGRG